MMYCPGWEVVGAAPGERFLFRTVQRRLDGQKINFMMYCPGGEVGADLAGWNISVSYRPEAIWRLEGSFHNVLSRREGWWGWVM